MNKKMPEVVGFANALDYRTECCYDLPNKNTCPGNPVRKCNSFFKLDKSFSFEQSRDHDVQFFVSIFHTIPIFATKHQSQKQAPENLIFFIEFLPLTSSWVSITMRSRQNFENIILERNPIVTLGFLNETSLLKTPEFQGITGFSLLLEPSTKPNHNSTQHVLINITSQLGKSNNYRLWWSSQEELTMFEPTVVSVYGEIQMVSLTPLEKRSSHFVYLTRIPDTFNKYIFVRLLTKSRCERIQSATFHRNGLCTFFTHFLDLALVPAFAEVAVKIKRNYTLFHNEDLSPFSWKYAFLLCQDLYAHLPFFADRNQLDELLAVLRLSPEMPPLEAIYIGLKANQDQVRILLKYCFFVSTKQSSV